MFELQSDITVGKFRFQGAHEVTIKKSLHSLVETATIRLPQYANIIKLQADVRQPLRVRSGSTSELFNNGDEVVIRLGYNTDLREEFRGFVRRRNFTSPFELECEGYSWKLMQTEKHKLAYKKVQLRDLLNKLIAGTGITLHPDIQDAELQGVEIPNMNALEALEELQKKGLVLYSFFIDSNQLYCGLKNESQISKQTKYWLGWNTVKDDELKYRRKEDVKVWCSVTYKDAKGKTRHVSEGEKGGLEIKRNYKQTLTDAQARAIAKGAIDKDHYEGYEGKIKTFLQPFTQPGWKAIVSDERYPERSGDFIIESVETRFGYGGGRRTVELGVKINRQK